LLLWFVPIRNRPKSNFEVIPMNPADIRPGNPIYGLEALLRSIGYPKSN
jgi:hypothetical protein